MATHDETFVDNADRVLGKRKAVRDNLLIRVLFTTGIRLSELCQLRRSDVKVSPSGETMLLVHGKGSKDRLAGPHDAELAKELLTYAARRPADASVFGLTPRGVEARIATLAQRAGLRHLHPHLGRHSYATNFLRAGGHELMLQRLLGHTSLEMTRRYVQFTEADLLHAPRVADPGSERR